MEINSDGLGKERAGSLVTTMSSSAGTGVLDIPDNLTIPQFFHVSHASRPSFSNDSPCLIEEHTGRTLSFTEVSSHVLCQVTHPIDSGHSHSFGLFLYDLPTPFI